MRHACTLTCVGYVDEQALDGIDLEDLAARIVARTIRRPEFFVQIRDSDGVAIGSLNAGPLYPSGSNGRHGQWCVTYADANEEEDGLWCLAVGGETGHQYSRYIFCGAETELLECCAVELPLALEAIRRCCAERGRAEALLWIDAEDAMNL
jgi:hypothetical protein